MEETDSSSFDGLGEFKKSNSYGKRHSFPCSAVIKNPNDIFNVFRGAMGTLNAMKIEEEQEQFYQPIVKKSEQSTILKDEPLHLPGLQDKLMISNIEPTTKYNVNEQVPSPRRRSLAAPIHKKSPREVPVVTVESNAPSTRFWTHPAAPPEHMSNTTSLLSLPRINRTTNGSKNAYAKSCVDGPSRANSRGEDIAKKRGRSNSLIVPYGPSTFGKSLQERWYDGAGFRRRSKAITTWRIQLHERKQPLLNS